MTTYSRMTFGFAASLLVAAAGYAPATLAQASRIPGMTPAALSLLLVHARKLTATGLEDSASEAGQPLDQSG